MSIINKMHQQLKHDSEQSPILYSLPENKSKQKILVISLISLLLFSAIGLLTLIYHKNDNTDVTPEITIQETLPVATSKESKVVNSPVPTVIPVISGVIEEKVREDEIQITPTTVAVALPVTKSQPNATVVPTKVTQAKSASVKAKKILVEPMPIVDASNEKVAHLSITKSVLTVSERADIHLKKAERALTKGDLGLVAQEKMKALNIQPELHKVRKSIALYYYGLGEQNRATNLLKQGALQFPEYSDFSLMLSRIALKNGEQQKAYLYLNQHPPVVQGHLDYHVSYAILAQKFKKYEQAETLYHGLLTQRPNNGRWLMSLAIAQDKQGKEALAVESYQSALLQVDLSSKAKKFINQRLTYLANQ